MVQVPYILYAVRNRTTMMFWMMNPAGADFRWTKKLSNAIIFETREKAQEVVDGAADLFEIVEFKCLEVPHENSQRLSS